MWFFKQETITCKIFGSKIEKRQGLIWARYCTKKNAYYLPNIDNTTCNKKNGYNFLILFVSY